MGTHRWEDIRDRKLTPEQLARIEARSAAEIVAIKMREDAGARFPEVAKAAIRVSWSDDDAEYVATSPAFPSLSHLAATEAEARAGFDALLAQVLEIEARDG